MVLPAPGRAAQQQRVAAGGGDLEGALRRLLAAHVGEVEVVGSRCPRTAARRLTRVSAVAAAQRTRAARRGRGGLVDVEAGREGRLGCARAREGEARRSRRPGMARARARAPRTGRRRPSRASSPTRPRPSSAAGVDASARRRGCRRRSGDRGRARSCARPAGARFTVTRRSGKRSPAGADRRPHPRRRLAHRRLGQPDDVDARELRADADLDLDGDAVHAEQRGARDARHAARSPGPVGVASGAGRRVEGRARSRALPSTFEQPRQGLGGRPGVKWSGGRKSVALSRPAGCASGPV